MGDIIYGSKKMKILFLSRSYYPNIGGVEKHINEISKILINQGHKITIITEKIKQSYSNNYQSNSLGAKEAGKKLNTKIIRIDVGDNDWFKKFRIWLQLIRQIKIIAQSDIIHCHDVFFWYLPFRIIFPFKKVYTTFHGYEGNKIPNKRAVFMHKLAEALSNGNICIGDFLKKWYGTKPSFVSYGAIDSKLLQIKNESVKKNKDVIFAGRLEEETGILEYLEAIYLLKKRGINLTLDIFGDGQLKNKAKEYVSKNKLNVSFKGFVSNVTDYISFYKIIFVSRYLGILEALALRIPIFAQYNNVIKKDYLYMSPFAKFISIGKTGEEIAKEVESYLKDHKKIDIDGGYKWVKDNTWENMVKVYLRLWKVD